MGILANNFLWKNLVSLFIHGVLLAYLVVSAFFLSSFSFAVVLSAMTRTVVSRCQESVVLIVCEPFLRQTLQ